MKQKRKLKCLKCNYEWESKSELIKVSCPSCGNKVINKSIQIELNKQGKGTAYFPNKI